MKHRQWHLMEAIAFFQSQGAPADMDALVELLQEVQQHKGGVIPQKSMEKIAHAYDIKKSFLRQVVRSTAELRLAEDTHLLEICGKKSSRKHGAEDLIAFVEQTYAVTDGSFSEIGDFRYTICDHLHGKGVVIRWDGVTYCHATPELVRMLVQGEPVGVADM